MKFSFQSDLDYQIDAIDAVTSLFKGQEALASHFTVQAHPALSSESLLDEIDGVETVGVGNNLRWGTEAVLENLRGVQERFGLHLETELTGRSFTVEMETGTGKTYVYLRTIYELNQLYGFTKFVIVVPSVPINEGVATSFDMLREHLGSLYGNPPVRAFQYSGDNVSALRTFATSSGIEIMIITVAAMNKANTRIHRPAEDLDFETPMDLLRQTRPIVIVDEPQSVYGDDGRITSKKKIGAGRRAIEGEGGNRGEQTSLTKGMNAAAIIRYSATHPKFDKGNLVYKLDAIAAYEKKLVKQIEVDSLVTEASGTAPYVRLLSTKRTGQNFTARVEVDVDTGKEIRRKAITVRNGDNLRDHTGREIYGDLIVDSISVGSAGEHIRFDKHVELGPGDALGAEVSVGERARLMIAQTIRQHLRKEAEFAVHGRDIKVLSLLFVDSVAKYRVYDEDGEAQPGEYARIFEEEYAKVAVEPEFASLLGGHPADAVAAEAHQGYFSIDRRKGGGERLVETSETTDKGRQQAGLAYEQIMKSKVWLTTPGTPIRFIFTHSALQEGWDNPNVFQICVLRNMGSERWRRQSIGRGLRLCVDGNGDRVYGHDINRLTVIANESYEEFAEQLQKELSEDLGIEFGVVTVEAFAQIAYKRTDEDETPTPLGEAIGQALFKAMLESEYIDRRGHVQESLRVALQEDSPELRLLVESVVPDARGQVLVKGLIKRIAKPIDIKKAGTRVSVPVVTEVLESAEFQELWDRIRHRTTYRLTVAEDNLQQTLVSALRDMAPIPKRKGEWITDTVEKIDQGGLHAGEARSRRVDIVYADSEVLPDILSVLADRTHLTRQTIAEVLTESGTLGEFKKNPQVYVDQVTRIFNDTKGDLSLDGLRYELVDETRGADERAYPLSLFSEADLAGYSGAGGNIISDPGTGQPISFESKSPYKFIVVDSKTTERDFALKLRSREEVKAFVKLPSAFQIPTPLGPYNPDWAVMAQRPNGDRYIVFETKPKQEEALLRPEERGKILAARRHFAQVRVDMRVDDLDYAVVTKMRDADGWLDKE